MGLGALIFPGILLALAYKLLSDLDLLKVIHNQYPGNCEYVNGISTGSEDIAVLKNGKTFISTGALMRAPLFPFSAYPGGIFLYDASNSGTATSLKINGVEKDSFRPAGISAHEESSGKVTLFVVNTFNNVVHKFDFDPAKMELNLLKTISSELFTGINNIVAADQNQFYVSNFVSFKDRIMATVELALQLPLGSVLFYDGVKVHLTISSLQGPNGLALSKDKKHLFTAQYNGKSLLVHKIGSKSGMDLTLVKSIPLNTSPDNLNVDESGVLWVATQPLKYQVLLHLQDPIKFKAASQILKVKFEPDFKSYEIEQIFADDGEKLPSTTTATAYGEKLLIGTIYNRMMVCNMQRR